MVQKTIGEMPSHNHSYAMDWNDEFSHFMGASIGASSGMNNGFAPSNGFIRGDRAYTFNILPTGENQRHNVLQPYITVYIWKRTL